MDSPEYLLVPWPVADQGALSDAEYCTYLLILSLAWRHDRHQTPPIGRKELAALRGLALRTLDAHLHNLRLKGYVRNAPGRAGLKLILIPAALEALAEAKPAWEAGAGSPPLLRPPSVPLTPPPASACAPGERPSPAKPPHGPTSAHSQGFASPTTPASSDEGDKKNKLDTAKEQEELLAISRRLKDAGVYPVVAERLAGEPWVSLELVEAWIGALRQRPHVRQLGGLLAAILRQPESCLPAPSTPLPPSPNLGRRGDEGDEGGAPRPEWGEGSGDGGQPSGAQDEGGETEGESPPSSFILPPASFPQGQLPWEQVLALLRQRLGEERVRVWLEGSAPLGIAEGRLIIALRSALGVDWVQQRYWRQIQEAVEEVTGRSLPLRFVVAGKEAGTTDPDAHAPFT